MNQLILASASTRRAALLELADLSFTVLPSYAPEEFDPNLTPEEIVIELASRKAAATSEKLEEMDETYVIGADTIVVSNSGEILNKPQNYDEASEMLNKLSGNSHKVITGICIVARGGSKVFAETTSVSFMKLSSDMIDYYIRKYHPFDKAGGYAIQEWIGAVGIEKIEGDYYNVMGLPVNRLILELKEMGYSMLSE